MDSIKAKIGWRRMWKRENKNYRSVPFLSYQTRNRKFQKKFQKHSKNKKNTIVASFKAEIGWKRPRKRENKNYRSVPLCSYPTRNRKFQKNSKKIQKIKKYRYIASFQTRIGWRRPRKRENKNYRSVLFLPDA